MKLKRWKWLKFKLIPWFHSSSEGAVSSSQPEPIYVVILNLIKFFQFIAIPHIYVENYNSILFPWIYSIGFVPLFCGSWKLKRRAREPSESKNSLKTDINLFWILVRLQKFRSRNPNLGILLTKWKKKKWKKNLKILKIYGSPIFAR